MEKIYSFIITVITDYSIQNMQSISEVSSLLNYMLKNKRM